MGLESILRKAKMFAIGGLVSLIGCMPLREKSIEARLGFVAPVAEEQKDYDASFMIGGAYGIKGKRGSFKEKLGLGLSLDYFHSSEQYIETNSLLLGANATYPLKDISPSVYLTGGVVILTEFSTIDIPAPFNVHDKKSNATFGLSIGANLIFDTLQGDIVASFSYIPLFSENVKGMLVLTGGYRF